MENRQHFKQLALKPSDNHLYDGQKKLQREEKKHGFVLGKSLQKGFSIIEQ